VKLAPDQPTVLNYLGYAQLERGENMAAAIALVERASKLKPDDAAITDSLGWAYYLQGNIPQAIATLERAVAGDPGQTTLNEHLGDAYWSAGRRVEARWAWGVALVFAADDDAARLRSKIDDGLPARTVKR
jgi:Flp pilus assembly protein TadD